MRRMLVLISFLITSAAVAQEQLPAPPRGYSWLRLAPLRATFLKPDGWFVKTEKRGTTQAFFISREDIDKVGEFFVGLTVNVIRSSGSASDDALRVMGQYVDAGEVLRMRELKYGPMSGHVAQIRLPGRGGRLMVHAITLANPKTNAVYAIIFEAPENEWDASWKVGETMLQHFMLDDED